jgi:hypothetical protein
MILSYKKMPYEKLPPAMPKPFSSTTVCVLCFALSFFWSASAVATTQVANVIPNPAKSQPKPSDALLPEKASRSPHATNATSTNSNIVGRNPSAIWDLTEKTDREINDLVRSWPQLNPAQRRDLLAEVRIRMNKVRAQTAVPKKGQGQNGQSDIEVDLNKAQRQYRYGQPIPRNQKGTVVITAKVTRILPDGTRVTQSTVTPLPLEALRQSAANNGSAANIRLPSSQPFAASGARADTSAAVGSSESQSGISTSQKSRRQVFRATVRFGAGFGRRDETIVQGQLAFAPAGSEPQNVQQVNASILHGETQKNLQNTEQGATAMPDKEPNQGSKKSSQHNSQRKKVPNSDVN